MLWCHQFFTQGHKAAPSTTRVIGFVVLAQIEFTLRCVCCRQCELSSSMTAVKVTHAVRGEAVVVVEGSGGGGRGVIHRAESTPSEDPAQIKIKFATCFSTRRSVYMGLSAATSRCWFMIFTWVLRWRHQVYSTCDWCGPDEGRAAPRWLSWWCFYCCKWEICPCWWASQVEALCFSVMDTFSPVQQPGPCMLNVAMSI